MFSLIFFSKFKLEYRTLLFWRHPVNGDSLFRLQDRDASSMRLLRHANLIMLFLEGQNTVKMSFTCNDVAFEGPLVLYSSSSSLDLYVLCTQLTRMLSHISTRTKKPYRVPLKQHYAADIVALNIEKRGQHIEFFGSLHHMQYSWVELIV